MNGEAAKSLTGMQQYPGFIKPFQEKLQESSQARGEMAGLEKGMETERLATREQARASAEQTYADKFAKAPQREQLVAVSEKMEAPFVPTKETAGDMAQLFALVNIAGFALGAGGKRNSQAALSGMNGMLEGYQKGRQDLYKKEKDAFDTNIKQLKMRYDTLDRQLKEALETYKTDKQAGLQKADMAYAQAGADFYKKYADKFGLAAMYEYHKQAYDGANRMFDKKVQEEDRARTQAFREEQARVNADLRRESISMQRERMQESRETREVRDAKLGPVERKEVRGFENLQDEVALLKQTFKPEYANFKADAAGDLMSKFKSRFQDDPGMAEWWRRYENVALPERHSMFGATLTGPERDSWRKASIGAGSSTKEVNSWIADKERVLTAKLKKYERAAPVSSAAPPQVRSFNTVQEAEAANLPKGTEITIGGRRARVE